MAFAYQKKSEQLERHQQQDWAAECRQGCPWRKANNQAFETSPDRQAAQRGKAGSQGFPAPFFEQQKQCDWREYDAPKNPLENWNQIIRDT